MAEARDYAPLLSIQTSSGSNQPSIQWVPECLPLAEKWTRHEAYHSHPLIVEVKKSVEMYIQPPRCHNGIHKDTFTFTFSWYLHRRHAVA